MTHLLCSLDAFPIAKCRNLAVRLQKIPLKRWHLELQGAIQAVTAAMQVLQVLSVPARNAKTDKSKK
jgi:hypothetical protein